MACYHPITAWRSKTVNASGKRSLVFNPNDGFKDLEVTISCGQCVGCRLERSRQWAMRCMHEASLHDDNCFITLTYNPENLPENGDLVYSDFQKFFKRLRKRFPNSGARYYMCGEYGDLRGRPHFHACVFGFDFDDKQLYQVRNGNQLYISETLNKLWKFGFASVGSLTFDSAAYVARYVMKKQTGDNAEQHYKRFVVDDNGEIVDEYSLTPEFNHMSLKPAIGADWLKQYADEVYLTDSVIIKGKEVKPPKFYDSMYELLEPRKFADVKQKRRNDAKRREADNTYDRLLVKEKVKLSQISKLTRTLE